MTHTDRQLAGRIAAGDARAFAQFVDLYGARLHRLAQRYAKTPADAEDLTQEIFVALFQSMGGFRGASALSTWTYRVALNHCIKHQQRAPQATADYADALHAAEDLSDSPAQCAVRRELGDQVHAALENLSPEHRDVVVLHELQDLTYAECTAILQVPIGTVKSRLFHAFRRLRVCLSGYVLDETPTGGAISEPLL